MIYKIENASYLTSVAQKLRSTVIGNSNFHISEIDTMHNPLAK